MEALFLGALGMVAIWLIKEACMEEPNRFATDQKETETYLRCMHGKRKPAITINYWGE